jgi:hypothetical protein
MIFFFFSYLDFFFFLNQLEIKYWRIIVWFYEWYEPGIKLRTKRINENKSFVQKIVRDIKILVKSLDDCWRIRRKRLIEIREIN